MSLRDFNNAPFSDDPTALHNAPSGNGAGLKSFHTTQPEDIEPNNMPKLVGAVVVALMIGAAGVALYASSGSQQAKPVVAANMPAVTAPAEPAPAADANTPATPPAETTPPPAPAAAMTPAEKTPAPVKSASIARKHVAGSASKDVANSSDTGSAAATRLSADSSQSTVQPQQQQAVAPQPSPSDVATNNIQPGAPQSATTASDIPAPQPSAAPAPGQQTAQPAAAQ